MKIIRKNLDNTTLFGYFSEYGPDFFKKLNKYKTCSVDVEQDGLTKIKYFKINSVGPLVNSTLNPREKNLNYFGMSVGITVFKEEKA